ncbi:MAG: hypothetical protein IJZ61_05255 [Oscillospiraceae bacterium]|nr:hypothetical protein [Oscillospiraceae bacterium]
MKKILIILMTVLALTVFTACESKEVEIAEETTVVTSEKTDTFKGTGYTLVVDSEKWVFDSENKNAEDDALFLYTNDMISLFKVKMTEMDGKKVFDMSIFDGEFRKLYEEKDKSYYLGGEVISVNGYDCFKGRFSAVELVADEVVLYNQYVILNGDIMYNFICMSSEQMFDAVCSDFEEVLDSISFE